MNSVTGRELRHRMLHYRGELWKVSMAEWIRADHESVLSPEESAEIDQYLELLDAKHEIPGTINSVRVWVTQQLREICGQWSSGPSGSTDLLISNRNLVNELLYRQQRHPVFHDVAPLRFMIEFSEALVAFLSSEDETKTFTSNEHTQRLPASGDTTIAYTFRTKRVSRKVTECPRLKRELRNQEYQVFLLSEFCSRSDKDIAGLLDVDAKVVAANVSIYEETLAA